MVRFLLTPLNLPENDIQVGRPNHDQVLNGVCHVCLASVVVFGARQVVIVVMKSGCGNDENVSHSFLKRCKAFALRHSVRSVRQAGVWSIGSSNGLLVLYSTWFVQELFSICTSVICVFSMNNNHVDGDFCLGPKTINEASACSLPFVVHSIYPRLTPIKSSLCCC